MPLLAHGSKQCQCFSYAGHPFYRFLKPLSAWLCDAVGCMLPGFLWLLCAGEFMVNGLFDSDCHLMLKYVHTDSLLNPNSFRIHIKGSKANPFHQGSHIYMGLGQSSICPISALALGNACFNSMALRLVPHCPTKQCYPLSSPFSWYCQRPGSVICS